MGGQRTRSHELLSGRGLEAAERWMAARPDMAEAPTALHLAFIKASRDAATRRRKFVLAGMAAALLFSIALAAVALWQRGVAVEQQAIAETNETRAKEERDRALLTQSRFLAQAATQSTSRGDAGTGMALALEALPDQRDGSDRPYSIEAEIALFNARLRLQERAVTAGGGWARFSPDGRQVVTMLPSEVEILDAASLKVVTRISVPDLFPAAAFSPDGLRLLTVSRDKTARISDSKSGRELATLRGHRDYVSGGDFSPDGRRVVTSSLDGEARIWDAETGKSLVTLTGHTGFVRRGFQPFCNSFAVAYCCRFPHGLSGLDRIGYDGPIVFESFASAVRVADPEQHPRHLAQSLERLGSPGRARQPVHPRPPRRRPHHRAGTRSDQPCPDSVDRVLSRATVP